jgi:hypothetical protein
MGLYNDAREIFCREIEIRSRVHKGVFRDIIYAGIRESKFRKIFSKDEIKTMFDEGWIQKEKILEPDGSIRSVIVYTELELPQMIPYKKYIEKTINFFRKVFLWWQ